MTAPRSRPRWVPRRACFVRRAAGARTGGAHRIVEPPEAGSRRARAAGHVGARRRRAAPAPAAAAAASSSAAAASSSAAAAPKRARDGDDDDGESAIPASLRPASGAERKKQAKAKAPKAKTAEQIATAYYHAGSSGSALAARGDFLTEHGMIEHRVAALGSRKYTIDGVAAQGKGVARLEVSFKGVRNQMHESVQWLSRDEMREVLRLLASRGSSSRRTASAASTSSRRARWRALARDALVARARVLRRHRRRRRRAPGRARDAG